MNVENRNKKAPVAYVNYSIRSPYVRVIEEGNAPRTMPLTEAVEYAKSKNLDLVQISYDKANHVAVAKLQDYGKFKYEQQKKEKAMKKAARAAQADVKEVCFSIRIDTGDKETKIKHIRGFLVDEKAKVKIAIRLLRRERNLTGMAKDLMMEILNNFNDVAELDSNPSFMNGVMSCTLRPKK